jgi:hypothetical protein
MNNPADLPLRDIHLPAPVSWWPPAPGWWLLAGMLLAALIVLLIVLVVRRRRRLKREALQELDRLRSAYAKHRDPVVMVRGLSALLRRACISFYPRHETASLTGERWLQYLDDTGGNPGFSSEPGRVLVDGPYTNYIDAGRVDGLIDLTERWLRKQRGGAAG